MRASFHMTTQPVSRIKEERTEAWREEGKEGGKEGRRNTGKEGREKGGHV